MLVQIQPRPTIFKYMSPFRYNKKAELRRQAYFLPGPVDPKTGNYTPSQAERDGKQHTQYPSYPASASKRYKIIQRAAAE